MIIVDDAAQLTVITQPDHARLAGEILSLWRADGMPEHPRRADLLLATREHDNGWQEADSAPRINPRTKKPFSFIDYPDYARLELWERGIFRFAEQKPLVALLIAEHAEAIHQPLSQGWKEFFEELEGQRQIWLEKAAIDRDIVRQDYRFLALADSVSLAVCARDPERLGRHGVETELSGELLQLTPCPLAGTTTFEIPVRILESRPYDSDSALGSALARARWERRQVKIGPFLAQDA